MIETSELEAKAGRFVRVANRVYPKMTKRIDAVVARGDVMTGLHNRDFDLPAGENNTVDKLAERAWAITCFAGSVAVNMPGFYVGFGRLWRAALPFDRELQKTMPGVIEQVENGETDYYSVAAEIIGMDAKAAMNEALAAAGISSDE